MKSRLAPVPNRLLRAVATPTNGYALIGRDQMCALAHAMTDSKSAVLFCLAWEATRQQRMNQGNCAGEPLARLSAALLAKMTGCPHRTVQWALAKLRDAELIELEGAVPGKTNVYRLNLPPVEV